MTKDLSDKLEGFIKSLNLELSKISKERESLERQVNKLKGENEQLRKEVKELSEGI